MVSLWLSVFLILHKYQVLACDFDSECLDGAKCCDTNCVASSDCYGYYCTSNEQCGEGSICCENSCVYDSNCAGRSCSSSSDCSVGEDCCDGTCQDYCDDDTNRLELVLVIGVPILGAGIFCCVCVFGCRRTRNRGQVIANRGVTQTTTTYGSMPPQAQHFYGGVPPGNYPPYPPPPPNMGYQSQYPVMSSASQQSDAPPAYADVVGSQIVQQHVGAAEVPHPRPSAPSLG